MRNDTTFRDSSVISVISLKGGVGKTTTAVHLAHGFAMAGFQTLLVDCDPSCNASRFFGAQRAEKEPGLSSFLKPVNMLGHSVSKNTLKFTSVPHESFAFNVRQNLDLLPGNIRDPEGSISEFQSLQNETLLSDALKLLRPTYSFIIIDTTPALTFLTKSALRAASIVLLPVDPGAMSVEAVNDLIRVSDFSSSSAPIYILKTLVNRRATRTANYANEALSECSVLSKRETRSHSGYPRINRTAGVLESVIHKAELAHQLTYLRKTSFEFGFQNSLALDYYDLVTELLYIVSVKEGTANQNKAPFSIADAKT